MREYIAEFFQLPTRRWLFLKQKHSFFYILAALKMLTFLWLNTATIVYL